MITKEEIRNIQRKGITEIIARNEKGQYRLLMWGANGNPHDLWIYACKSNGDILSETPRLLARIYLGSKNLEASNLEALNDLTLYTKKSREERK